jgi:hypothetical protein
MAQPWVRMARSTCSTVKGWCHVRTAVACSRSRRSFVTVLTIAALTATACSAGGDGDATASKLPGDTPVVCKHILASTAISSLRKDAPMLVATNSDEVRPDVDAGIAALDALVSDAPGSMRTGIKGATSALGVLVDARVPTRAQVESARVALEELGAEVQATCDLPL